MSNRAPTHIPTPSTSCLMQKRVALDFGRNGHKKPRGGGALAHHKTRKSNIPHGGHGAPKRANAAKNSKNLKRKMVDGEDFNGQISQFLYTAEALLAHAVGERLPAERACTSCKRRNGKLVSCVLVPGKGYCTNCLWPKQTGRCEFHASSGHASAPYKNTRKRGLVKDPDEAVVLGCFLLR